MTAASRSGRTRTQARARDRGPCSECVKEAECKLLIVPPICNDVFNNSCSQFERKGGRPR